MAGEYLPPVVVRLVAETAEAVAGLERFGAALTAIGERATAAGAEVDAAMAGMAASTGRVDAAMAETGASVDRMAAQAVAANERTAASYNAPTAAADRYAAQADADCARIAAAQERVAASNQAMAAKIESDSAAMETANARAVTSTEKVGTAMDGTTAKAGASGAAASRSLGMIGLAAGAVGVETVKMASTFDQSMERLVTMAHTPQPVVDDLKQRVLALGASTGQGPDKLADALYHLTSTGMNTDTAMHALESSAKLATMGMSDLDTTAYALAGVMSAAPPDIHNTDQAVAMMASTVGQGDMKMQDLANSIKSGLLPTMIQAGMGFRDYGAAVATVSDNSMPAEMAANRLRTAVMMLSNETGTKATAALKDLGMTSDQTANDMRSGGMLQVVTDLKAHMDALKPAAGDAKLSLQQITDEGQKFYDQMIQDGASTDDARKATDKYKESLTNTGSAGVRAMRDIEDATGGSKSASTILLLTDEVGKLQQKYNDMGTSVQQEQEFQQHWNDTTQLTAVKAQQAKAGLEALGIQIGEDLMPAVNACLGAVARFGAAITQGSEPARVLATIIEGLLAAAVVSLGYRMVAFVGGPLMSMVTGFGRVMGAVADYIAKLLGMNIATEQATAATEAGATAQTTAVEEAARAQTTAIETGMGKMVAATREGMAGVAEAIRTGTGPVVTSAEAAGTEAGAAQGEAYQTALLEATATAETAEAVEIGATGQETVAAARTVGAEAGAAQSAGMAGGLAAGEGEVAAAGGAAAAGAGAATKAGWLGKFARSAGEVGLLLVGADFLMQTAGIPTITSRISGLVDEINHMVTGDALSPSTSAMEAWDHRVSNSVRETFGLADLYSKDGMARINTTVTQGADQSSNDFIAHTAPMPPAAQKTVDNIGAIFGNLGPKVVPPTAEAVDAVGNQINRLPNITRDPVERTYDQFHNSMFNLAKDGDVQGQAVEHAVAQHIIGMSSTATGQVAAMHDRIGKDFDDMHAHADGQTSALVSSQGAYFAHFHQEVDAHMAGVRSSVQDNMDKAQAHVASGGHNMVTDAQKWADQFGKTVTNGGQAARDGMNKAQDDMRAHTAKFAQDQTVMVFDWQTKSLQAQKVGEQQSVDTHQRWVDDIQHRNRDGLAGLNRDANTYWQQYPRPIPPAMQQGTDAVRTGVGNQTQEVGKMPGEFAQQLAPLPGQMRQHGNDTMQGFKDGRDPKADEIIQDVKNWASNLIHSIGSALGIASPSTIMHSMGVDFMQGFLNGAISMMNTITTTVQNWINSTVAAIRSVLQIASPSRVMHEIGRYFMEGFHDGIVSQHQNVVDAVENINADVISRVQQSQTHAKDAGWAMMQGWFMNADEQDAAALKSMQQSQTHAYKNQWGCWVCGKEGHDPLDCPNRDAVLTLTRATSGIGVQDGTTQAGTINNITVQGTVLDHQGVFQALQEAALRSGQRNSFTGGFGSPR